MKKLRERLSDVQYNYMTSSTQSLLLQRIDEYMEKRAEAQLAMGAAAGRESDWHDNAAFDLANEQFNFCNAQIMNAQKLLERVCLIEPREETDTVQLGNRVRLQYIGGEIDEEFLLLGPADSIIRADCLSYESPLGKIIIGRKTGDHIQLTVDGKHQSEIIIKSILPGDF